MRRIAGRSTASTHKALFAPAQRSSCSCPWLANAVQHASMIGAPESYATVGAFLASPLGTAGLVLLAYNVSVVGVRHLHHSLDMVPRDYIQDPLLLQVMRYMFMIALLLGVEQLFVEV